MQYVNNDSNNYGFTIIEVAIVLVVIVSITMVTAKFFFKDYGAELADQTITEINLIKQSAITYYAKNGHWPGQVVGDNDCSDAFADLGAISGVDSSDPYNSQWYGGTGVISYETSCSPAPANAAFSVSLTLDYSEDKKWVNYILTKLPLTETDDSGMRIQAWIPAPSGVAAMQNYFSRNESAPEAEGEPSLNDMETAINLNGNVINDYAIVDEKKYKLGLSGGSVLSNLMFIPNSDSEDCDHDWADASDETCFTLDMCPNNSSCHSSPSGDHKGDDKNPLGSIKANDIYIKASKKYLSEVKNKPLWIHKKSYRDMQNSLLFGKRGVKNDDKPKKCNPEHEDYEAKNKYICTIEKPECDDEYSPKIIIKPNIINADIDYVYYGNKKYRNKFSYIDYTNEWDLNVSLWYQGGVWLMYENISTVNVDTYCVKND